MLVFCWFLCLPSFPYTTFLFGVFISPQSHRMKLSKAAFLLEICISLICITVKRVLWHFSRKRPYEILTFWEIWRITNQLLMNSHKKCYIVWWANSEFLTGAFPTQFLSFSVFVFTFFSGFHFSSDHSSWQSLISAQHWIMSIASCTSTQANSPRFRTLHKYTIIS